MQNFLQRRGKFLALTLALLFATLFFFYFTRAIWLSALGSLVIEEDRPSKVDAIVLLAGSYPRGVLEAADLYKENVSKAVYLTRERYPDGLEELIRRVPSVQSITDYQHELLLKLGVPENAIHFIGKDLESTRQEALAFKNAMQAGKINPGSLLLIARKPQSARSKELFSDLLPSRVQVYVRSSRYDPIHSKNWWKDTWYLREVTEELMKRVYNALAVVLPLEKR